MWEYGKVSSSSAEDGTMFEMVSNEESTYSELFENEILYGEKDSTIRLGPGFEACK